MNQDTDTCENTDTQLWASDSASVHCTVSGGIGINSHGMVHVKTPERWIQCANADASIPELKHKWAVQNAEAKGRREQMEKALHLLAHHRYVAKQNGAVELATILDLIYREIGPQLIKSDAALHVTPS